MPCVCTRVQQRFAVVLAQFVVLLALRAFEFAVDGLLGLLRQFARHLLFGAPQDERAQRLRQKLRAHPRRDCAPGRPPC